MKDKDVVKIDYELWAKETDELVDTTKQDLAVAKEIFDEQQIYKPMATIVGAGKTLPGMDDDLKKAKVGEDRTVEISPEDAYGARDSKLVELISMTKLARLPEFRKGEEYPEIGKEITWNGKKGRIVTMTPGRVRVDFNHPLAGKTLVYKYTVLEAADSDENKILWTVEAAYGKDAEFSVNLKGKLAEIVLPDICKYDQDWFMAKDRVVGDLRDVAGLETIRFVEEYVKKADEEEDTKDAKADDKKDSKASDKKTADKKDAKKPAAKKTETKKTDAKKPTSKATAKTTSKAKTETKSSAKTTAKSSSKNKTASKPAAKKSGGKTAAKSTAKKTTSKAKTGAKK